MFTLRDGLAHSVNLVYVRLMRDLVSFHEARLPYDSDLVLNDPDNPVRLRMLREIADKESEQYSRFPAPKHFLVRAVTNDSASARRHLEAREGSGGSDMNTTKRKTIEGWIDKASNQCDAAREHLKSFARWSEAIQAAQQCVELSVKSILSLLDIHYSPSHEWAHNKKEFAAIAEQIQQRHLLERLVDQHLEYTVRLPRLPSCAARISSPKRLSGVSVADSAVLPLLWQKTPLFRASCASPYLCCMVAGARCRSSGRTCTCH